MQEGHGAGPRLCWLGVRAPRKSQSRLSLPDARVQLAVGSCLMREMCVTQRPQLSNDKRIEDAAARAVSRAPAHQSRPKISETRNYPHNCREQHLADDTGCCRCASPCTPPPPPSPPPASKRFVVVCRSATLLMKHLQKKFVSCKTKKKKELD